MSEWVTVKKKRVENNQQIKKSNLKKNTADRSDVFQQYQNLLAKQELEEKEAEERKLIEKKNLEKKLKEDQLLPPAPLITLVETLSNNETEEKPITKPKIKVKQILVPNYQKNFEKIKEIAEKIPLDKLTETLEDSRNKFPKSGIVQLKMLAEFFEKFFAKTPVFLDPSPSGSDISWIKRDTPMSFLSSEVVEAITEWMEPLSMKNHENEREGKQENEKKEEKQKEDKKQTEKENEKEGKQKENKKQTEKEKQTQKENKKQKEKEKSTPENDKEKEKTTPENNKEKDIQKKPENLDELSEFLWFLFNTFLENELLPKNKKSLNGTGIWILMQIVIRNFPYTIAKIIPNIQEKFMTSSPSGYILKKPKDRYILEVIGNCLQSNGKIAMYCWLKLLLPTIINTDECELLIKFVEEIIALPKDLMKKDNGSSVEFVAPESILALISFLGPSAKKKQFQQRLKNIYQRIIECSVFSSNQPHLYFTTFLPLISVSSLPNESEDTKYQSKLSLNIVAASLMLDPQCHQILLSNYAKYQLQTEVLLQHITSNWDKFLGVAKKKGPEATRNLIKTCSSITEINNSILNNTFRENGKTRGVRALGFTREQLGNTTSTSQKLLNILQETEKIHKKREKRQRKPSRVCNFFIFFTILMVLMIGLLAALRFGVLGDGFMKEIRKLIQPEVIYKIEDFLKQIEEKITITYF